MNVPINDVKSSGALPPAAIHVAPAVSGDNFIDSTMISIAGTKNSSQTSAIATNIYSIPIKWKIAAPCLRSSYGEVVIPSRCPHGMYVARENQIHTLLKASWSSKSCNNRRDPLFPDFSSFVPNDQIATYPTKADKTSPKTIFFFKDLTFEGRPRRVRFLAGNMPRRMGKGIPRELSRDDPLAVHASHRRIEKKC